MKAEITLVYKITVRPQDLTEDKHISKAEFQNIISEHSDIWIKDIYDASGLVPDIITTKIDKEDKFE